MSMKVTGAAQVLKNLQKTIKATDQAMAGAIYLEANAIMNESDKLVPMSSASTKETTSGKRQAMNMHLRATSYVKRPEKGAVGWAVKLGYWRDYALWVHEMTRSGINWTRPGSGAKFLEKPFRAAKKGYFKRVAKRAGQLAAQGGGMPMGTWPTREQ
jgi:hypothetical protein